MSNLKPSEILRAGLNLLETKGWTQHAYAKDKNGDAVFTVKEASCFCGIGSIRAAAFQTIDVSIKHSLDINYAKTRILLSQVVNTPTSHGGWVVWQDEPNRTFAEVKAKFLEAIQLAEQQENTL